MSNILQSGHHPDADLLSAFVERALPAHERDEMLAHLAVCPDCRAVAMLTMPQEMEQPKAVPAQKSWLSRWSIVWAPAAAFATLALVLVSAHTLFQARIAAPAGEVAAVREQERSPAQAQAPAPPAQRAGTALKERAAPVKVAPPPVSDKGEPLSSQSATDAPVSVRNFTAMAPLSLKPASPAPATGAAAGSAIRSMQPDKRPIPGAMAMPLPPPQAQSASASSPPPVAIAGAQIAEQRSASSAEARNLVSAPPAMAKAAMAQPPASQATFMSLDSASLARKVFPAELPSHLPVLSFVSQADRALAIDARSGLFLSSDGGKNWKAVQAPWVGHAVKVDLANPAHTGPARAFAHGLVGSPALRSPEPAVPNLTGVVTDRIGAAIPGANVTASNSNSGAIYRAQTDATGHYAIGALPVGPYKLTAEARGFAISSIGAVDVRATGNAPVNFALAVGAATETIEVTADAPSVLTTEDLKKNAAETDRPRPQPAAVFRITTDAGQTWTSADGQTWVQEN